MSQDPGGAVKRSDPALFAISIDQIENFEFRVKFDKEQYPDLLMDEPAPLGKDSAPNPSRLLAAAIGNCLCASFLFCTRKVRADLRGIHATVSVWQTRNEQGRLRIGRAEVVIEPKFDAPDPVKLERCLGLFEEYCVVTQSVRRGIEVSVSVKS